MTNFLNNSYPSKMLESLNRLRLKKELCDVILCCGGKEFPCHRIVLASYSSYFEAMFTTGMMESTQEKVEMIDVEPQAMEMLLSYAYTSKGVFSSESVQALLAAAHLLNVSDVLHACCRFMERQMDEKNCLGIHCLAETYSCKMLMKTSMDYILEHFGVIYKQKEFLSLSVDKLTEILASDKLNVTKEEMVFEAAMLWLNHSPDRKQSFEKVMEHIRRAFINPSRIEDVSALLYAVESQACQRLHRRRWSTVSCEVILMVASSKVGTVDRPYGTSTVETFHPQTNRWKTLKLLPFSVDGPGLVMSGSTVYLAGGRLPVLLVSRDVWRYDPSLDSWLQLAPMHKARMNCGLVMLDGYVFAVGGANSAGLTPVKSVERYNPHNNTWQLMESGGMPDLGVGGGAPVVTIALDGLIYVISGNRMFTYKPERNVWREAARIPTNQYIGSAVCGLKGKIYVIGGQQIPRRETQQYTGQVVRYDPTTNKWGVCSPMKKRRFKPGVAVAGGKIYVLGGMDDQDRNLRCVESFNDQTNTWEIVGLMPAAHSCFSCVSFLSLSAIPLG